MANAQSQRVILINDFAREYLNAVDIQMDAEVYRRRFAFNRAHLEAIEFQ